MAPNKKRKPPALYNQYLETQEDKEIARKMDLPPEQITVKREPFVTSIMNLVLDVVSRFGKSLIFILGTVLASVGLTTLLNPTLRAELIRILSSLF